MSELTPQARAFLEAHKHAGEPTSADAARVRAALDRRLATSPPKGLTGLKVGVLVTVVLAGALFIRARQPGADPVAAVIPAPTRVSVAPAPRQEVATPPDGLARPEPPPPSVSGGPSRAPSPGPLPRAAPPTKAGGPQPKQQPAPDEAVRAEPGPSGPVSQPAVESSPPPPAPEPERVVPEPAANPPDELALVSEAENLLRQGQPRAALATLTTWEVHFARSGQFVQEALAGKVVALCSAGDLEAGRAEARAFFERFPRTVARNRIERACAP